jgi:amino acid transporter
LRKNEPQLYRPFRVPFYPITPIMSIIVLVFMIAALSFESLVLGSILGIVGLILYRLTRKSRVKA